jgi:hypothetical protein
MMNIEVFRFTRKITWNGRDNLNRQVSPEHILHLDVTDAITGQQYQAMAPLLLGCMGINHMRR